VLVVFGPTNAMLVVDQDRRIGGGLEAEGSFDHNESVRPACKANCRHGDGATLVAGMKLRMLVSAE